MGVDNGQGASITFGTSGFTANIESISHDGLERESIPTTHLGTTTARTFIPGDLYDPGELTLDVQFNPDDWPPIDQAAETITVTFPLGSGASTPATWAASGFATGFNYGIQVESLMTGQLTCKFSGAITDVDEA